jgi:hypothetical protein
MYSTLPVLRQLLVIPAGTELTLGFWLNGLVDPDQITTKGLNSLL